MSDSGDYYQRYREEHRDEIREKAREHYALNKDRIKETRKAYYHANKDKVVHRVGRYKYPHRAVFEDNGGEWVCAFCRESDKSKLQIHHKNQDRNNNDMSNLVCLCRSCHTDLHNRWLNEVIPSLIDNGIITWTGEKGESNEEH